MADSPVTGQLALVLAGTNIEHLRDMTDGQARQLIEVIKTITDDSERFETVEIISASILRAQANIDTILVPLYEMIRNDTAAWSTRYENILEFEISNESMKIAAE
jgi:hypothetical protein